MARWTTLLTALLLTLAPVALADQDDADSGDDAEDICEQASITVGTNDGLDGSLDPPRDTDDFYLLQVTAFDVGAALIVSLDADDGVFFDVLMPECGQNVVAGEPVGPTTGSSANGGGGAGTQGGPEVQPTNGDNGQGHDNEAPGHQCSEHGHTAECDGDGGSRSSDGNTVTFEPSQVGLYVIYVFTQPGGQGTDEGGGSGGEQFPSPDGCHDGCGGIRGYSLSTTKLSLQ